MALIILVYVLKKDSREGKLKDFSLVYHLSTRYLPTVADITLPILQADSLLSPTKQNLHIARKPHDHSLVLLVD